MGYALQINTLLEFVTIECFKCGVIFAVQRDLNQSWLRTKNDFYCPNGHSQAYIESEADRLRKQLAAKEQALVWEQQRAASLGKQLDKQKKAQKALERRVSKGVCPCCQRTVSQLARHMKTKHPDYATEIVK